MSAEREFWEAGGVYRTSEHPVVELFARQRIQYLRAIGALEGVRSLLDVGAGSGFSSAFYPPEIRVVATDYAAGMIGSNPVRDRLRSSAYALPFPDGTFDAVSCWELLHHLEDPRAALREMLRVSRNGLIVFEPNRLNPGHWCLAALRENERQALRFSPRHVRQLVLAAGGLIRIHVRCGLIFPNITPLPIARLLRRLPFRVPTIAISQLVVVVRA